MRLPRLLPRALTRGPDPERQPDVRALRASPQGPDLGSFSGMALRVDAPEREARADCVGHGDRGEGPGHQRQIWGSQWCSGAGRGPLWWAGVRQELGLCGARGCGWTRQASPPPEAPLTCHFLM